ncbi:MAG: DUF2339 domain-containing protein [Betaproteobacteria bacterium HGW-Betaproteobacteria-13]|jgi:uncharacterized membrane protein|nr:MAG: DUF2339 domain-containing protein [Betaproteobacteria bacterium HGW-Betaproteobacteria-19]PKO80392.1 MAG: DUF2339 domain-containing protein [Betaproteobacteria bacterium HGW-Betaproteobacteria-13]
MSFFWWVAAGAMLGLLDGVGVAFLGAVLGGMVASLRKERTQTLARHESRIAALERELDALNMRLGEDGGTVMARSSAQETATAPAATSLAGTGLEVPASPDAHGVTGELGKTNARVRPADSDSVQAIDTPLPQATARSRDQATQIDLDALYTRCRDWLFGGNTLVRTGILVLFFGLAFLVRYAMENAMLPPELRLAGIACVGIALGAVGWRLRHVRRGYALSLQGGGIAVLYLTAFAALRLYGIMPATTAFAVMLALVGVAAFLAIRQDAAILAIIGSAGGFAAPILASTGSGSHVQLFTYYALLNAGVLLLAWRKAWRGLNLTGFIFTFAIGLAWGARFYHPWHFNTTEPFLLLFFLMYVAAAVSYAWKQAPALRDPVDGTLVFGVPVVGFGLQAALVHGMPYALAWSAAAVGVFYLVLAAALKRVRKPDLELLIASFVALGIAFLSLAIPLAFDGRWSAAAWALEGAALWWIGRRQQRRLPAASGLLLQLGAGVLFAADLAQHSGLRNLPVMNSAFLGSAMIAGAGFVSAWLAARNPQTSKWSQRITHALLAWTWLWWLGGAWAEIDTHLATGYQPAATLVLFALSGALACALAPRLTWPGLLSAGLIPLAGMMLALGQTAAYGVPPSGFGGWLAWPLALVLHAYAMRALDSGPLDRPVLTLAHAAGVWVLALALSQEAALQLASMAVGNGWQLAAHALPPALLLAGITHMAQSENWPMRLWKDAYQLWGAGPLALVLGLWLLGVHSYGDGSAAPFAYVPLLNPLDLTLAAALGAIAWWLRRSEAEITSVAGPLIRLQGALGLLAFVAANAALLRAMHHTTGVPWDLSRLLGDDTTQAALSLFWAILGLGLMLLANRRSSRVTWLAGAGLMAAVVCKLFLVDMAASGTLTRIVSFIGAGMLLLVVGYFSPLPPRQDGAEQADTEG